MASCTRVSYRGANGQNQARRCLEEVRQVAVPVGRQTTTVFEFVRCGSGGGRKGVEVSHLQLSGCDCCVKAMLSCSTSSRQRETASRLRQHHPCVESPRPLVAGDRGGQMSPGLGGESDRHQEDTAGAFAVELDQIQFRY